MAYDPYEVVVVPFPFANGPAAKRRPALVLSDRRRFGDPVGHSVLAMVTSARHRPWPLDTVVDDLSAAGLPVPSVVRMKLFTLDHRAIQGRLGALAPADVARVMQALSDLLGLVSP